MIRNQRGQATAEFALVVPVLLLCILGFLYLGLFMLRSMQAHGAAVQAARAGIELCPQGGDAEKQIEEAAAALAPDATVQAVCTATEITVNIKQTFPLRAPGFERNPEIEYTVVYPLLVR